MGNAAILVDNVAAATGVVLTASGWDANTPPSNLLITPTQRRWQVAGASGYILADLLSATAIDTVALEWVTGVNPTFRLRLATADSSGVVGDAYDSGAVSGLPYFDPDYGRLVFALPASHAGRYLRVDIVDVGVASVGAGFLTAGVRSAFGKNYQLPWSRTAVRGSINIDGVGGQTFIDLRQGHWRETASFGFASVAERAGFLDDIGVAIVNRGHKDFFWLKDPASANLARDCLYGFVDGDFTLTENIYVDPPVYSVEFPIRQRL